MSHHTAHELSIKFREMPEEDDELLAIEEPHKKRRISTFANPIFILSQVPKNSKPELIDKIKRMKGTVIESDKFEPRANICIYMGLPIRNEKISCSLCAGLHVLPATYITNSYEHNNKQWLDPSDYRISYDANKLKAIKDTKKRDKTQHDVNDILRAANYWRERFAKLPFGESKNTLKPFYCWQVVLYFSPSKGAAFQRLIEAGGGQVITVTQNNEEIENHLSQITHLIISPRQEKEVSDNLYESCCHADISVVYDEIISKAIVKASEHSTEELLHLPSVKVKRFTDIQQRLASNL